MAKAEWLDRNLITTPNHYCLCTNEKEYHKILKKLSVSQSDANGFPSIGTACVITFETEKDTINVTCINIEDCPIEEAYSLLTHEAVHLWQNFRDYIGEKFPSPEFEAYCIQKISHNLMESYKRQAKKHTRAVKKQAEKNAK